MTDYDGYDVIMKIRKGPSPGGWTFGGEVVLGPVLGGGSVPLVGKFVATDGNNGNPGTEASPWLTLQYAFDQLVDGDTLWARGGTFAETVETQVSASSEAARITIRNYPGEIPVIDSDTLTGAYPIYFNPSGANTSFDYVTLQGFEIKNSELTNIKMDNGFKFILRDCNLHHAQENGVFGGGYQCTFRNNRIWQNGQADRTSNQYHGIYINGSEHLITRNLIYENTAYGIQLTARAFDSGVHPDINFAKANAWTISKNVIANEVKRHGIVVWETGGLATALMVEDTIFYENGDSSANAIRWLPDTATGDTVRNCLFYHTSLGPFNPASPSGLTTADNVSGSDPDFVDEVDFVVNTGSPALGAAVDGSDIGRWN